MENLELETLTKQSFEEVLEINKERIYRICRIYAAVPIEPQDLFQEVVFQVWKSFHSFEGRSNISTWIYKIAINVGQRSKMKLDRSNEKTVRMESIQFLPTTHNEEDERYEALRSCISHLNQADQSIVILFLEELSYKEIGEIAGLTENHVAVKMKRIRKKLFECITKKV